MDEPVSSPLVPAKQAAVALVRCNPQLMERLRKAAIDNARSLNGEMVHRLASTFEESLPQDAA